MKSFVAVLALVALAAADVSHILGNSNEAGAQIVAQESDVRPDGYNFGFQTSNGISGQEAGQLKNVGREDEALETQGSYGYIAPDGTSVQLTFIANEFGYQAKGDHLPTTPAPLPIPEAIQRALAYIAAHPPKPETFKNY